MDTSQSPLRDSYCGNLEYRQVNNAYYRKDIRAHNIMLFLKCILAATSIKVKDNVKNSI